MKLSTNQLVIGGYTVALLVLGVIALLAFASTREYVASVTARRKISSRLEGLAAYLSLLKDAETGQRGFLLTKKVEYLPPYSVAIATWQAEFEKLAPLYDRGNEITAKRLDQLRGLSQQKIEELERLIRLRRSESPEDEVLWRQSLEAGEGRDLMDSVREVVAELEREDRAAFEAENERVSRVATRTTVAVGLLSPLCVGLIVGAILIIQRDLRRRAAAEAALSEQRRLFLAIVNSMNEGVAVADETGHLVLFNPAAERMLGRGSSDADPEKWASEFGVYYPDKTTLMPMEKLPLVRALGGETVDQMEIYVRPLSGAEGRYLMVTGSPLVSEGGRCGGVVIMRDVTATRAAERRFQSLLESAPDGLLIVNHRGIIELVNTQTERLFGYEREQLLGKPVEQLVPEAQRAAHPAQRDAFFANPRLRGMGTGLELSGQRADGSLFPVEISLSPVEGGESPLVCAAIRDVTDRRQVLEQIRQLNNDLEDRVEARTADLATANRELSQRNQENEMFVYSVSHDLRSPLVNLQGFSQELSGSCAQLEQIAADPSVSPAVAAALSKVINGDIKESIHFIRTSVSRLSGIIDALLRLSRAGRVVYQWQTVNVERLVQRVLDAAKGTIVERQAEVVVHPLPMAAGDPTAIDQVFGNLIQNALHYLDPRRPGKLEVGVIDDASTGEHASYYVRDNGTGIPEAQQAKVFQAFQRLQPDRTPGEGMGLTLVQRIIERHGGRIWVESTPGVGSTFFFTLPTPAEGEFLNDEPEPQ